jgi:hypothetical protein
MNSVLFNAGGPSKKLDSPILRNFSRALFYIGLLRPTVASFDFRGLLSNP